MKQLVIVLLLATMHVTAACAECPKTSGMFILSVAPSDRKIETYASEDGGVDGEIELKDLEPCHTVEAKNTRRRRLLIKLASGEKWISQNGITVGGTVTCITDSGETSTGAGRASNAGCTPPKR